jgi:hypothetical protein
MAIPATLQAQLTANGINAGMPGWTIADNAQLLPPTPGSASPIGDTPAAGLTKLMTAFYNYGRIHFTWTQASTPMAAAPGLLTGGATSCACATFNANLRFLAERACGIAGITNQALNAQFLTIPGGVCIDSKWNGNVRTAAQGFDQLKSFKFATHYWLELAGRQYDVCYNNSFVGDVAWTRLVPADAAALQDAGVPANQLYKLAKPLPSAEY